MGAGANEGEQPADIPYYELSPEDREVLEKAMDDTRSPDPSLSSRASKAFDNALKVQYGDTILSKALAAAPDPLGGAAQAGAMLGMAFAGLRVRGEWKFSDDAVIFRGELDPATYNENLGRVIVTKASYDPETGEAVVKGEGAAGKLGVGDLFEDPPGTWRRYFGWQTGVAGLSTGTTETFVSGTVIGQTHSGSYSGESDADKPTVEETIAYVEDRGNDKASFHVTATLQTGQNYQLCGHHRDPDGAYGWSCRDLPGGDGTMPTGELGEIEPGDFEGEPALDFNADELADLADMLRDDPDYGPDAGMGSDLPGGIGSDLPGSNTGDGIVDDDGGSISLPDEPPGFFDPDKPGGIGDGHRPGEERCVEIEGGWRVIHGTISQAAWDCLQDGTEQAWEGDPDDEVEALYPPEGRGCMDYAPGASCIDTLKAEGWSETERTETIVRVCPPRNATWFLKTRRCGPIERITPDPDGGVKVDLPPCIPSRTRFDERTCYRGPIKDAITDLLRDMRIDMDRVVFDSESKLVLRRPVCFPPAMRKRKALDYLLDLAGWGVFPGPDCHIIIGLNAPLSKVWTYHEDIDLLAFDLEWDRYEAYAFVQITKPDRRTKSGRIVERGFSRRVAVNTPVAVGADKIKPMTAPRGMSEEEAVAVARAKASQIARRALPIIQFAVPANSRMRLRHQLDIVRPSRNFRGRYMITKLGRDISADEGDLSVGQARWVVSESRTP